MTAAVQRQTPAQRIERELESTLELVDELRRRSRRDELPGWVWLRAGRGCWLTGNLDWARDFYKRAAGGLAEYAMDVGRRTGTFESYAAAALGAAWMADQREVLADTGRQLDTAAEQMLNSVELPPEPLVRTGLLMTRLRASWYREQTVLVREHEAEVERRAGALDAWSKAAWQAGRDPLSHVAIRSLVNLRSATPGRFTPPGQQTPTEIAKAAFQALDRHLNEQRAKPPSIGDLVDEELISLAAAFRAQNVPLPVLRMPVEPGKMGI